jgi:hypothetical protein
VNNVVAGLKSDNMHCGCFGQYASYVAGILNSVKEINFYVFSNKRRLHCTKYLEKCISNTQCSISFKSHTDNYFVLISGEEKVVIKIDSRFLHGKLPSKLMFTYAVFKKIRLSSLPYGVIHINNLVIYGTNEVLISQHDCVFEQCTNDLNIPKELANCKLFIKSSKAHPYTNNCFSTLYCTKKSHRLLGDPQCHCALCIKKTSKFKDTLC